MLGVYRDIGVVDILAVNITTPLTHLLNILPQKSCIAQFGPYKSSNIEWYSAHLGSHSREEALKNTTKYPFKWGLNPPTCCPMLRIFRG